MAFEVVTELVGRKVTVFSGMGDTERQDIGTVEKVDSDWLKLRKENGDVLFFGLHALRLIKPFEKM